ncbi:hypothetical protein [Streptomyces sp. NPDC126514]|uniref:hypothetical protein n=1 Tax=Streptomyces sp. NPDC126514 TaxID=3155210 RepID=UPI003323F168
MIAESAGRAGKVDLVGAFGVDGFEEPFGGQTSELVRAVAQRQRVPGRAGMGRRVRYVDARHSAQSLPHPGCDSLSSGQIALQAGKSDRADLDASPETRGAARAATIKPLAEVAEASISVLEEQHRARKVAIAPVDPEVLRPRRVPIIDPGDHTLPGHEYQTLPRQFITDGVGVRISTTEERGECHVGFLRIAYGDVLVVSVTDSEDELFRSGVVGAGHMRPSFTCDSSTTVVEPERTDMLFIADEHSQEDWQIGLPPRPISPTT